MNEAKSEFQRLHGANKERALVRRNPFFAGKAKNKQMLGGLRKISENAEIYTPL